MRNREVIEELYWLLELDFSEDNISLKELKENVLHLKDTYKDVIEEFLDDLLEWIEEQEEEDREFWEDDDEDEDEAGEEDCISDLVKKLF